MRSAGLVLVGDRRGVEARQAGAGGHLRAAAAMAAGPSLLSRRALRSLLLLPISACAHPAARPAAVAAPVVASMGGGDMLPPPGHLCALGYGDDPAQAELDAKGALAQIFSVQVRVQHLDTAAEQQVEDATGPARHQSQSQVARWAQAQTHMLLEGAQIVARRHDSSGRVQAQACLPKAATAAGLRQRAEQARAQAAAQLAAAPAATASPWAARQAAQAVLATLAQVASWHDQMRVMGADVASDVELSVAARQLAIAAAKHLRLRLVAAADLPSPLRLAAEQALSDSGLQWRHSSTEPSVPEVQLQVSCSEAGHQQLQVAGRPLRLVRGQACLALGDGTTTFDQLCLQHQAGGVDVAQAQASLWRELGQRLQLAGGCWLQKLAQAPS